MLTDLDLGKLSYLATQAAGMSFSGDMLRVTGDAVLGQGNRVELTVDQQALYDLILDVFYEERPAPTDTAVSRMRTGRFIGHFSFVQNGKKAP